jgi:hypothetical protein
MTTAVLAALVEALEHRWVGWSLHIEKSGRALLQPAQAVIDENISPRNLRLEFDHRRPAGRDQGGLHIAERLGNHALHAVPKMTRGSKQISPSDHDPHSSQYSEFKGADTNAVHVIRYLECHSMMPGRNISVIGQ